MIFSIFRWLANLFSGSGLRDRYQFIDQIYKLLNRGLSPSFTEVFGHRIYLDRDDSMGLSVKGLYEPAETQIVMENVKLGYSVVDIGANIGYFTLLLASLVGPEGQVIAFEPDPESCALLKKNVRENGYKNIKVVKKAVSNTTSEMKLFLDRFNNLDHRIIESSDARRWVKIDSIRMEDYFPDLSDSIDFIKMDIQGAEGLALEGMRGVLEKNQKIKILTEFWPEGLEISGYGAERYLCELADIGFRFIDVLGCSRIQEETSVDRLLDVYLSEPNIHTNILCIRE